MAKGYAPNDRLNYVKIAGFFYSIIIVLSFVPSQLLSARAIFTGDDAIQTMAENEFLYRIGTTVEFLMFISVMVLSWALYVVLKSVNKNLAQLAFALRFGEALLGCFVIILYVMALYLLDDTEYLKVFSEEQRQALGYFFLKIGHAAYFVLLTVMGIGAAIFCYLFYISRYIPRAFAIWGIITYFTMIFYGLVNLTHPEAPKELMFAMIPGALFEFLVGLWLLFKGINTNPDR